MSSTGSHQLVQDKIPTPRQKVHVRCRSQATPQCECLLVTVVDARDIGKISSGLFCCFVLGHTARKTLWFDYLCANNLLRTGAIYVEVPVVTSALSGSETDFGWPNTFVYMRRCGCIERASAASRTHATLTRRRIWRIWKSISQTSPYRYTVQSRLADHILSTRWRSVRRNIWSHANRGRWIFIPNPSTTHPFSASLCRNARRATTRSSAANGDSGSSSCT